MNMPEKPLTAVLIGAGHRGHRPFGEYALQHPGELKFVAVVEPDGSRRQRFAELHGIPESARFSTAKQLYKQPRLADILVNASSDRAHVDTTLPAFKLGYHVLLEKPIAASSLQVLRFFKTALRSRSHVWVMHELRWSPFFQHVKTLLEMKTIGEPITWQHSESPAYWHMAHSYVRGNWRRQQETTPILLAKACHDLDLLIWLLDRPVKQVHSFGSLTEFRPENAPENAPFRCTDGCPVAHECPYDAKRIYLGKNTDWPASVISADSSLAARRAALENGPYGRCVYYCDNDVVDHQVVNLEFSGDATVAFTLTGHGPENTREFTYDGTKGRLTGNFERNTISAWHYPDPVPQSFEINADEQGHGGGDPAMIQAFLHTITANHLPDYTALAQGVYSHVVGFAAEESRENRTVIELDAYGNAVDAPGWRLVLETAFPEPSSPAGVGNEPVVSGTARE